ncbi:hypothetical protein [Brooklawnia sp.]|uniref:hypothetical protein n=1 Tax=Brooklawnia sp. TaxID=2699740 RepID=UPI00311FC1BA
MTESGFSADERAAMKHRAEELRSTKGLKGAAKLVKELESCMDAIEALEGTDKAVATLLHRVVSEEAPELMPKTWYGFPSYAKDGKLIVYYQPASKFKTPYGTIGFSENAALDDGDMWPNAYAVIAASDGVEQRLRGLVRRAASDAASISPPNTL